MDFRRHLRGRRIHCLHPWSTADEIRARLIDPELNAQLDR
jgi:hypothetical protein